MAPQWSPKRSLGERRKTGEATREEQSPNKPSRRIDSKPPVSAGAPVPNPRLCDVFGRENVMRRNGAPSVSLGERRKTGDVRR